MLKLGHVKMLEFIPIIEFYHFLMGKLFNDFSMLKINHFLMKKGVDISYIIV